MLNSAMVSISSKALGVMTMGISAVDWAGIIPDGCVLVYSRAVVSSTSCQIIIAKKTQFLPSERPLCILKNTFLYSRYYSLFYSLRVLLKTTSWSMLQDTFFHFSEHKIGYCEWISQIQKHRRQEGYDPTPTSIFYRANIATEFLTQQIC